VTTGQPGLFSSTHGVNPDDAKLSSREVERLLIERGVEVFYETVCQWVLRPQGNAEGKQAAWNDDYMLSLQAG
jgi:hypothetical protein